VEDGSISSAKKSNDVAVFVVGLVGPSAILRRFVREGRSRLPSEIPILSLSELEWSRGLSLDLAVTAVRLLVVDVLEVEDRDFARTFMLSTSALEAEAESERSSWISSIPSAESESTTFLCVSGER
jgi:hypothetical protein